MDKDDWIIIGVVLFLLVPISLGVWGFLIAIAPPSYKLSAIFFAIITLWWVKIFLEILYIIIKDIMT